MFDKRKRRLRRRRRISRQQWHKKRQAKPESNFLACARIRRDNDDMVLFLALSSEKRFRVETVNIGEGVYQHTIHINDVKGIYD